MSPSNALPLIVLLACSCAASGRLPDRAIASAQPIAEPATSAIGPVAETLEPAPVELQPTPAAQETPPPPDPVELSPGTFGFVTESGGHKVFVATSNVKVEWLKGRGRLVDEAREALDSIGTMFAVDERKMPVELALRGKKIDLYEQDGVVCQTVLGRPSVLVYSDQKYDAVGDVYGGADFIPVGYLVFELQRECKGATWGRLSALPSPTFAKSHTANPHDVRLVRDALTNDSRLNAITITDGDPFKSGPVPPQISTVEWQGKELVFSYVSDGRGCDSSSFADVYEKNGDRLKRIGQSVPFWDPSLYLDIDGDGSLEVVNGTMLSTIRGAGITSFGRPFYGCPC